MRRLTSDRVIAPGLACLLLGLPLKSVHAASYAQMEAAAREQAASVHASRAERAAAQARKDLAASDGGARAFASTGYADAREPVTDTLVRNYGRAHLTVGVRWPFLASQLAQKRNVTEAEWDMARAQLREDLAGNDAVRKLRAEAVKAVHARQRVALASGFVEASQPLQAQLQARVRNGAMLAAEAMELQDLGHAARTQLARHTQAQTQAEAMLRHQAGLAAQAPLPEAGPSWGAACFDAARLMQEDGRGLEAAQEINLAAASAQLRLLDGGMLSHVEAGVQLAHSRLKDSPGHSGHNTGVFVDFQLPLQWRSMRDSRRNEWTAKRQQAETLLQQERHLRQFDVDRGLRERELLQAELEQARMGLKTAQEGWRVTGLRAAAQEGESLAQQYRARHAVYGAGMRVIDISERLRLAEVELLALGPVCPTLEQTGGEAAPAATEDAPLAMASAQTPASEMQQTAAEPPASAPAPAVRLGWYVWDAQPLLQEPQRLKNLPPTSRLLLSFKAEQLRNMDAAQWGRLYAQAQRQGIRLELLLGDPHWVQPQGRRELMSLLASARGLRVDALHLDLEHSQLPKGSMDTGSWKQAVVQTMREAGQAVPWPLVLTTHHRDLDDARFLQALHQAGVGEVVPMVYSQNQQRVKDVTLRLLEQARQAQGLRVGLAQSIERELSPEESSHHKGRQQSQAQWAWLARELSSQPHFSGVIVQSLAEYQKAKP